MPALLCCSFESDLMCQSCEPWIPAALLSFCRCRHSATREDQTHCTEHLNSGNSAKVLNLCDFQKQAARGVVSVSQRQTSGYHLDGRDWSTDNLDSEFGTAGFHKTEPQQRDCVQLLASLTAQENLKLGLLPQPWPTAIVCLVPENGGRYAAHWERDSINCYTELKTKTDAAIPASFDCCGRTDLLASRLLLKQPWCRAP